MMRYCLVAILVVLLLVPSALLAQDDDIEIYILGVAQPFTGSLGTFGTDFARGIDLAVKQMNEELETAGVAVRFEVVSQDTEQTPEGAARAVQTIVQTTGAQVIVGPLTTAEVLGAKQFVDEHDVVIVAPASSGPAGAIPGDNIYRVMYPPDGFAAKAFADIATARGYENVAILHLDDPFGNGLAEAFEAEFLSRGGSEVATVSFAPEPTDLSSEVTALSAEVDRMSGDGTTAAFCICFLGEAQMIFQQAQLDVTLSEVEWMGVENLQTPDLLVDSNVAEYLAGANLISVSESSNSTPNTQPFIDAFVAEYGSEPGPFTNYAFDAANIAMLSMLAAGNDGEAVKSMLPFIANHYIGTAVQAYLDENGDQAVVFYGVYEINDDMTDWEAVGTYDGGTGVLDLGQ